MTLLFVYVIAPVFVGCCITLFQFWLEQCSKK
ncbi:TPA: type I toxin-antitoxin system Fst family toxin [Staphylococcus aureus]|nr:type I toxin-antitoxin system Fst family toxin [Staphylococcus aureus]